MLEALPQATLQLPLRRRPRPGVVFQRDGNGNTSLQSGAQNFDHVNVFIDGVGQKNNILRGGLAGQDTSRNNPFPQSAIAEYRVLTQNYKAEFDQVSSAAITAVTKSGTSQLRFGPMPTAPAPTGARSPSSSKSVENGVALPPSSKKGVRLQRRRPIKKDQVHFFFAYDGKKIDDSRQVVPRETDKLPASAGIVPTLLAAKGSHIDSFTEHLLFGKVDANLNDEQRPGFSRPACLQSDHLAESADLSAPGSDKDRKNDETRLDLKHEWIRGDWLSRGPRRLRGLPLEPAQRRHHGLRQITRSPPPIRRALTPRRTCSSPAARRTRKTVARRASSSPRSSATPACAATSSGRRQAQVDEVRTGWHLALGRYRRNADRPRHRQPYYSGGSCTGTNISNGGANGDQCKIDRALPSADANFSNRQLGLFIQDDWAIDKQLELNLGVRWDYESNMLNNGYATPADRVAALRAADGERWGIKPRAARPTPNRWPWAASTSTTTSAPATPARPSKGAIAPRLGFSYDVTGDRNTVVFGGWGRSYDRTMANHALDELQRTSRAAVRSG